MRLPPLDLIRGFVAVGRRMSITLAAEDLCLTQSAVSRQIRTLEEMMGVRLLNRGYRSISFSPEGEHLFRIADEAVRQLQDAVNICGTARERQPVTITASIGVTALWILPRLCGFQQTHPEIDLRVAANNKLLDLKAEGADLAIRCCSKMNAPTGSIRLFGEAVVPVAHTSLLVDRLDASTIGENVLIELDDLKMPWLQWSDRLSQAGLGGVKPKSILRFNQYDQVISAAMAGQGIALGRIPLISSLLAENRLVVVGGGAASSISDYAYWLIQASAKPRADVREVVEWIMAEVERADCQISEKSNVDLDSVGVHGREMRAASHAFGQH